MAVASAGALSTFLEENNIAHVTYALNACGVKTLAEMRRLFATPRTSYRFCSDLLNKGVHNFDLKTLKSHCKRGDADSFEAGGQTWNFRLLVPFDLAAPVSPTHADNRTASEGRVDALDEAFELSMVGMRFT
jgi:hypothetical protein